jgi:DNA recombination protein RmuC
MEQWIYILVAVGLGLTAGWLIARSQAAATKRLLEERLRSSETEKAQWQQQYQHAIAEKQQSAIQAGELRGQLERRQAEAQQYKTELEQQALAFSENRMNLARLTEKLAAAETRLAEQKRELTEFSDVFRNEFRLLANGILKEKSQEFTAVNEEKMKNILDPLQLHLKEFRQQVADTYDKESKERFSLEKELKSLIDLNKQLGEEANNLTRALKHDNKAQGNWGEMILESLLEHSGLTSGREYFVQDFLRDTAGNVLKDENGRSLQPDVVVVYPDQRKVIIDSKVSLVAFEQYTRSVTVEEQAATIREHLRSLRSHIDGLSGKNYPRYAGNALDYVVLFIPVEPAFLLAVKEDPQLWKYAYDKRILLVSPTNLLAVLKIIADLWKVERQSQHAIEIAEKAGALYDKFVRFAESLSQVGVHIRKAGEQHEEAMKRLSSGRGNLVRQAEQLRKMGASANLQLPDSLVKDSEEE